MHQTLDQRAAPLVTFHSRLSSVTMAWIAALRHVPAGRARRRLLEQVRQHLSVADFLLGLQRRTYLAALRH